MKIFWCEQSGILEDRSEFINELHKEGIEFHRLNWKFGSDDKFATVPVDAGSGLSWSKGRERLHSNLKERLDKNDYLVFADDDILFLGDISASLQKLKKRLAKFRPTYATLAGDGSWATRGVQSKAENSAKKAVFPFFCADLQIQIMRADYASIVFPSVFDGGWGTLWYPAFANCKVNMRGNLYFSDILVKNTRSNASGDYGGAMNKDANKIWEMCGEVLPWYARLLSHFVGCHKCITILNRIFFYMPPMAPSEFQPQPQDINRLRTENM